GIRDIVARLVGSEMCIRDSTKYSPPSGIASMSAIGSDEVGTGDYFGPITVLSLIHI
ncbi:hypothetical protein H8I08_18800, partial [Bacillus pumilus]|nr:hypothetical protein [Bacillus pumilus]